MDDILGIVCTVLMCTDIAAFVLLLCRPMKRIIGVGGFKGTLAGLGGGAVFTAVMLLMLRREVREALTVHKAGTAVLYLSLLVALTCLLILTHRRRNGMTIEDIDLLDGQGFENVCASLMLANGFENIEQTKASGDFGVDILAERDGLRYGVQCKRYNKKLDSRPVQEISAGMAYYGCDVGAVMTNSGFTDHAAELAEAGGIELWDRETIIAWLKNLPDSSEEADADDDDDNDNDENNDEDNDDSAVESDEEYLDSKNGEGGE